MKVNNERIRTAATESFPTTDISISEIDINQRISEQSQHTLNELHPLIKHN